MMMSYLAGLNPTIYTQTTQSGTYAITPSDFLIMGNPNAGGFTWTLPSAVGLNGKMFAFKNINSSATNFNAITIDTTSAQTIDGASTKTLVSQNEELWLISDNVNWRVLHRYIPSTPISFTPTGSWVANVTYTGALVRNGMYADISVKILCSGAPTAASLTLTLPFSLTINTSAFASTDQSLIYVGGGCATDAGVSSYVFNVNYNTSTTVGLFYQSSTAVQSAVTQAAPFTFGASDFVTANFRVPIAGWNS